MRVLHIQQTERRSNLVKGSKTGAPQAGRSNRRVHNFAAIILAMRFQLVAMALALSFGQLAFAQCAPGPDSPYFFRGLAEQRAEAKLKIDRAFYEDLLSVNFAGKDLDGKSRPKREFIDRELAVTRGPSHKGFYAVRDFNLVEHRQGLAITSYLLIEGEIGEGKSNARETWQRETFEVQDGKWHLVSIENVEPATAHQANNQPGG